VSTVIEPVLTRVISKSTSAVFLEGVGSVTGNSYFWGYYATTGISVYFSKPDSYYLEKNYDGSYNWLYVWIYNNRVIYTSEDYLEDEADLYDTAVMLYVDRSEQADTDETENSYSAHLLVNGIEKVLPLNDTEALYEDSETCLTSEEAFDKYSPVDVNGDGSDDYSYRLVNYTVDSDGKYTLSAYAVGNDNELILDAGAVITRYDNIDGYVIKTNGYTYIVSLDESSTLYYLYSDENNTELTLIGAYTVENMPADIYVTTVQETYLVLNSDGTYTLNTAIVNK
ncbi:MAG: hypothetical protein IKV53_07800, partial [Clostridia bacterium]|nr:hypothetical protein [Clostridia bacterium]